MYRKTKNSKDGRNIAFGSSTVGVFVRKPQIKKWSKEKIGNKLDLKRIYCAKTDGNLKNFHLSSSPVLENQE